MGDVVPIAPKLAEAQAREAAREAAEHEAAKAACVRLGVDPSILDWEFVVETPIATA